MNARLNPSAAASDAHAPSAVATAAEAFLCSLRRRGVEHFYIGSGTDSAPIVEAYARQPQSGLGFPKPVVAVHENLAVGMAHGYTMVTGRPQAVMLHVSVGAANAVCGIMNAARSQVPMFFTAGRTPLYEHGRFGARDNTIHWGQEMFDQAGMMRELVKWDYELRDPQNLDDLVDRGMNIAMEAPRGPIYLTLPREVLAQPVQDHQPPATQSVPTEPAPDPAGVERLAQALMAADTPVIVCTASGTDTETPALLVELAERFGVAVAESKPRVVNFPSTHALHAGYDMATVFARADALLFLESDVPWLPGKTQPKAEAFVAHAACEPLFARYPVRSFRSDLSLTSNVRLLLQALIARLDALGAAAGAPERRVNGLALARSAQQVLAQRAAQDAQAQGPISKIFLSRCLDEVRDEHDIVVNEYSALREQMRFTEPNTFFLHPNAGGLGWGVPAALGAKQARPASTVFAVVGDGAYLFANPSACHQASAMHQLPIVTVVFNNGGWDAVQKSTFAMYQDTHAAAHAQAHGFAPLSSLDPLPAFELYAQASGGHGERVSAREELIPALRRAIEATRRGQQALINVIGQ